MKKLLIIISLFFLFSCQKEIKIVKNEHKLYPLILKPNSYNASFIKIKNLYLINTNHALPKDFIPFNLTIVSNINYIKKDNKTYLDKDTLTNLTSLFKDAKEKGINLCLYSGYRSYEYQDNLYQKAKNKAYVARAGHSEHQAGIACDIGLLDTGLTDAFQRSNAYYYLEQNAYKYGFIERYKKEYESITGYPGESWHYTYVGKNVSYEIYMNNFSLETYFDIYYNHF